MDWLFLDIYIFFGFLFVVACLKLHKDLKDNDKFSEWREMEDMEWIMKYDDNNTTNIQIEGRMDANERYNNLS